MLKRIISSSPVKWLMVAYENALDARCWREGLPRKKEYYIVCDNAFVCEHSLYSAVAGIKALLVASKDVEVTDVDLAMNFNIASLYGELNNTGEKTKVFMEKYDFLSNYYEAGLSFDYKPLKEQREKYTKEAADKAVAAAAEVLEWTLTQLDGIDSKYRTGHERFVKKRERKRNSAAAQRKDLVHIRHAF